MSEKSKSYKNMPKKVYIRTFGCQMNDRDTEALLGLFLQYGYTQAKTAKDAQVILINTCSVRKHAEDRAVSFVGSFKKLFKKTYKSEKIPIIGIIGCMAKNRGQELFKKMPYVSLICGPASFAKIPAYVKKIQKQNLRIIDLDDNLRDESLYQSAFRMASDHAQVVISTGCSNFCSYCIVPYVRGQLRLRDPKDILAEVEKNIALGIRKITLLGQNVNDYRFKEPKVNFLDLLKRVEKTPGLEELDFLTSQPRNTSKELFTFMKKSPKLKKHLHLPFQSGSDRILKLMNRGYAVKEYLQLVKDYKVITSGSLSTDVIVGFPTETDADFQLTKDILENVKFKNAYLFKYSVRLQTKGAKLNDDVLLQEKVRRHKILLDLQKKISLSNK